MRRFLLFASGTLMVALVLGFLSLGVFPPKPVEHPVHATVPVDRLAGT